MWKITKLKTKYTLTLIVDKGKRWQPRFQLHTVSHIQLQTISRLANIFLPSTTMSKNKYFPCCSSSVNDAADHVLISSEFFFRKVCCMLSFFHTKSVYFVLQGTAIRFSLQGGRGSVKGKLWRCKGYQKRMLSGERKQQERNKMVGNKQNQALYGLDRRKKKQELCPPSAL